MISRTEFDQKDYQNLTNDTSVYKDENNILYINDLLNNTDTDGVFYGVLEAK